MSGQDVARLLHIACRALTDLSNDPELEADLRTAYGMSREPQAAIRNASGDFESFIGEFMRAEKQALLQSGCDMAAAEHLLEGLDAIAQGLGDPEQGFYRLDERIRHCAGLSCAGHMAAAGGKPDRALAVAVKDVVKGVTIISVDVAAEAYGATGLLPGTLASISINLGTSVIYDALRKYW
ncbi:MAG: hypothetical protein JWP20_1549 [Roseomonas sp.]|jgi:hypothetical protein|nr:hypothetical protein [Roseomonas sp.]